MITKSRLSDNASLGDISTNSNCDQPGPTEVDSNSEEFTRESMNSDDQCSADPDSIVGAKHQWSSHKKPIPGILTTDDSCNAVDNKLSGEDEPENNGKRLDGSELSFNGKIKPLKIDHTPSASETVETTPRAATNGTTMTCELIDATKGFERGDNDTATGDAFRVHSKKDRLNESYELLTKENSSWIHYKNEKSPDLFADDDDNDGAEEDEEQNGVPENDNVAQDPEAESLRRRTSGIGADEPDCGAEGTTRSDTVERVFVKRLQSSLSGVPPPPSLTFSHIDVERMLSLYRSNVEQWQFAYRQADAIADGSVSDRAQTECLSKPTHLTNELAPLGWPDLLGCRAHGLHYNRSTVTEQMEQLGLKYIERYIGAETSSSFNMTRSPSSAKKRNQRMKMLNQSPGSRLSHLAKRRAIFSSANLLNTSGSSGSGTGSIVSAGKTAINASVLNRLNPFRLCNRQVLLDPKKSDNRRKNKVKTPQRRSPALGRKSPRRRTPGSSAKKLSLARTTGAGSKPSQQLHVPASLESSKRVLFLSPPNGSAYTGARYDQQVLQPGASNSKQTDRSLLFSEARMMKSKRSLFSPPRGTADAAGSIGTPATEAKVVEPHGVGSTTMPGVSMKRRRSPTPDRDGTMSGVSGEGREKIRRKESFVQAGEDLTPRSLKFARSQSFCVGSQTVAGSHMAGSECAQLIGGKSLFRANSEITSEDGNRPVMMLTENHKKKLLWAVSQALKDKQVPTKHEMFKQHASNLARVVKRLFLEFNDQTISSTSEKMLRLATKHVYEVIQGRSVDDIYLREKTRLMNVRNLTKLQGYIAPEEYELRKLKRAGSMASMASSFETASPFDGSLSASQSFFSQSSIFSQGSSVGGSFSQLSEVASGSAALAGRQLKTAASTGSVSVVGVGVVSCGSLSTTVLRENIDSELRQRSTQKQLSFSGKDQKNVSPYRMDKGFPTGAMGGHANPINSKLLVGGALNSSILKAKRQISFE